MSDMFPECREDLKGRNLRCKIMDETARRTLVFYSSRLPGGEAGCIVALLRQYAFRNHRWCVMRKDLLKLIQISLTCFEW